MKVAFYLFEQCLTHVVADRVGWVLAIVLPGCRRAVYTHVHHNSISSSQFIRCCFLPCSAGGLVFAWLLFYSLDGGIRICICSHGFESRGGQEQIKYIFRFNGIEMTNGRRLSVVCMAGR